MHRPRSTEESRVRVPPRNRRGILCIDLVRDGARTGDVLNGGRDPDTEVEKLPFSLSDPIDRTVSRIIHSAHIR